MTHSAPQRFREQAGSGGPTQTAESVDLSCFLIPALSSCVGPSESAPEAVRGCSSDVSARLQTASSSQTQPPSLSLPTLQLFPSQTVFFVFFHTWLQWRVPVWGISSVRWSRLCLSAALVHLQSHLCPIAVCSRARLCSFKARLCRRWLQGSWLDKRVPKSLRSLNENEILSVSFEGPWSGGMTRWPSNGCTCVVCSRILGMCGEKVTAQRRPPFPCLPGGSSDTHRWVYRLLTEQDDDSSPSVTFGAGKGEKSRRKEAVGIIA